MICPKCGHQNPDWMAECQKCLYKFRFGHGYGDPAKRDFGALPSLISIFSKDETNPRKTLILRVGVIIVAVAFIAPIIISLISALF